MDSLTLRFDIADGRTSAVRIEGESGFHPSASKESTVRSIESALTGIPIDSSENSIAARIRAAIPFGVSFPALLIRDLTRAFFQSIEPTHNESRIGFFSLSEVHALTNAWKAHSWRIIPPTYQTPEINVALDEVLVERLARNETAPTLRFWQFTSPALILGRTQSVTNEIDLVEASKIGATIVRRISGGGTMFAEPTGVMTYSLYLPESLLAGINIRRSYELCDSWVIRAMREMGIDAHHIPVNDIGCASGKIGGAAQARRRGTILHHTMIAHSLNQEVLARVLRINRPSLREKGTRSAPKVVAPLSLQTNQTRDEISEILLNSFRKEFGGTIDQFKDNELTEAEVLVREKYTRDSWTEEFE